MRRSETVRTQSGGFTLIELIVVIAIIAILAGLLLQVIVKVREAGPRVETKQEIGQMGLAIENYKSTYDVKFLPCGMILSSNYSQTNPASAQVPLPNIPATFAALSDSRSYYSKVWPKGFISDPTQPNLKGYTMLPPNQLPLNPNGPVMNVTLDGNQALVLLLGGVPPGTEPIPPVYWPNFAGNRSGFLNSPTNPFNYQGGVCQPGTGDKTKGAFFDFKLNRIDANGHYHDLYWDGSNPSTSIYYYFSSRNGNDYNFFGAYSPVLNPAADPFGFNPQGGYGGMSPFIGLDGKYINPTGFQIISPGRNAKPGTGGVYDSGVGVYAPGADGGDDIGNWGGALLGGGK